MMGKRNSHNRPGPTLRAGMSRGKRETDRKWVRKLIHRINSKAIRAVGHCRC